VLLLNKSDFSKKEISIELDYAPHLPQVEAISDQIKQVFFNLLANAADACSPGGGRITIRTWQENEEMVAVSFQDTGVGIRPEDMDFIFQPFYTTKAEVKGTGLGLSVSYGIIQQHQGEVRVASQPHCGATFTVILPIKGSNSAR
jgi:signal transduction histidine kinase